MSDDMTAPVLVVWGGDGFKPASPYHQKIADRDFVIGERYLMAEIQPRSYRSERHYFACLDQAWKNLPEDIAAQYPTRDHLRKKALIRCGYADERSIPCASRAEAVRVAAFVGGIDDYAIVTVKAAVVTRYTAKSQSRRAMGKEEFQKSKDDVLDFVAALIGVSAEELSENAER